MKLINIIGCFLALFLGINSAVLAQDTLAVCLDTKAKIATIEILQETGIPNTNTLSNEQYDKFLKSLLQQREANEPKHIITLDICDENTDIDAMFRKRDGYVYICNRLEISTIDENGKAKKKAQLTKEIKTYCQQQAK